MNRLFSVFSFLIAATLMLSACGTASPAATDAPAPTEAGPQIGGAFVIASASDFATLDIQKSIGGMIYSVWSQLGASLVVKDPSTNEFVPYLAEKWEVAPDGMSYTFTLRKDIKFHDGSPLTADDYVFTFQRILNPETASPTAGAILLGVSGVEKVDDYTFKVTMAMPNSTILQNLSNLPFFAPYPKAYFEKVGADEFAKHPISVGPFKFKEYVVGDHLTLERNPDFTWGPSFTHGGPAYIENIVFRIIPEQATILAGMEAGEIDEFATDQYADADRIKKTGNFTVYKDLLKGSGAELDFNHARAPFDDVKLRQAFNYAIDREALMQVAVGGNGVIQYGPLSESTTGYWPGVKDIGYALDLAKAKSLLEEAGYT